MTTPHYVIFTDLDGTLLDHDTYSHAAADTMLSQLKQHGISVIPNTSKTSAELHELRTELDLDTPFIVENGAAVYLPKSFLPHKPAGVIWRDGFWVKELTFNRQYWLRLLEPFKQQFAGKFTHFSAMTIEQICQSTGLSPAQAKLASQRQFGEPILWLGDESTKQEFITELHNKGARTLQGGRFLHLGGECDKGTALSWVMSELAAQCPDNRWTSIALGDGQNDVAMLQAADIAVRIRSDHHAPPNIGDHNKVITSTLTGPAGWNESLSQLLKPVLEDTQNG